MIALFLLATSSIPLALALLSQFGFGLHPCELCIWQRYPYVVLIGLAMIALLLQSKMVGLLWLSLVVWLVEAGLAIYHVGVEQHWWQSLSGCVASVSAPTLDALRNQIMQAPLVACDQPEFVLFGLSMAGWNGLYSFLMVLSLIYLLKRWNSHGVSK